MARAGSVFAKRDKFDLKDGISLSKKGDKFIFQINDYETYYSETYDQTFVVIETKKRELLYSFSESVVSRITNAINRGISLKRRVVQVVYHASKYEDEETGEVITYTTLEAPEATALNEWRQAQFEANQKPKAKKEEK